MRFSLRQLQIFTAVARLQSISGAAAELTMSQSAASTALLEFERRYDRPLFDRAGKRLKINETGRSLLPAARDLLDRAEEIDALLAGCLGPRPLRLGATQTIGSHVAPRLMETYTRRHPEAPLSLEIGNTAEIADKVADFSLDLALIEGELTAKSSGESAYGEGARVFHVKFGPGSVASVDGNKLTVDFDKAGRKMVLDSFVQKAG